MRCAARRRSRFRPLREILPLYNTGTHNIVRAGSPFNYLHHVENTEFNGGILSSGAALITRTRYRMMFKGRVPEENTSYLSSREALVKLIGDRTMRVVVAAAPTK